AVPLDVFHIATAVADEMVMPQAFHIEARGTALGRNFAHQARLHQVPYIVIGGGPRRTRVHAIHSLKDLRRRGMALALDEEAHDGVALWRAAQPAGFQRTSDRLHVHALFGINLI